MISPPPDKDELRRRAPLPAVCAALGIRLDTHGWGKCPFHQDSRPSFNVYVDDEGVQRWGCFPCGIGGDAFDLVQRVRVVGFGEAIRLVAEIARNAPPVAPAARPGLDVQALQAHVLAAQRAAQSSDGWLCVAATLSEKQDPDYDQALKSLLYWGVTDGPAVVMPHFSRSGDLTGCKMRAPDGHKWSFPGSKYEHLYGCWLPRRHEAVLLTEGETDFAHAGHHASGRVDVRSLPSGAGLVLDRWIDELMAWDTVFLGLDSDDAGYAARSRVAAKLHDDGHTDVRALQIPEGEDLRSCQIGVHELLRGSDRVV